MYSASVVKWLNATVQAELDISNASAGVDQQVRALQASILLAQDHLSPENLAGHAALATKTNYAEQLNRVAHRLAKVIVPMKFISAASRRLADLLTTVCLREPTAFSRPVVMSAQAPLDQRPASLTRDMATLKQHVDELENRANEISIGQVWEGITSLEQLMTRILQQTTEIMHELHQLTVTIGELDKLIDCS